LDELEQTAFRFFEEQSHPATGLVRDRARADGSPSVGKASIAASAFSFGAWIIATERGWVARDQALARIRLKLRFLADKAPSHHGFFYHFMEMDTGARAWSCELSSIDSALLYAGMLLAREYFADAEVTALVSQLLAAIDWEWFRNDGKLVSLSWHDETGFSRHRWNHYSEHILMSFLALGISKHPLGADYWQLWRRAPLGRYGDFTYLQVPPLFVNQFPQAFLDLRDRRDAYADYFHNATLATLAQRQFSLDLRSEFPLWSENLWGVTSSDSATGYKAWGGPPRTLNYSALDGTVVPCATAGSLPFAPSATLAVLHNLRDTYGERIWKRYGFVDAFNPHTGWVNPDVLGIDLGISMLMAENLRTGLIWRLFMQAPEVQQAMHKAGFLSNSRAVEPAHRDRLISQARVDWSSLRQHPTSAGLQLTATIAARHLGLLSPDEFISMVRSQLSAPAPVRGPVEAAEFAAALITLRQDTPSLAPTASGKLAEVAWNRLPARSGHPSLGAAARLEVFLQIATGALPAGEWANLGRATESLGPVQVLAPADIPGAVRPGLWLDERAVLSGASASQLAYASLFTDRIAPNPFLRALQLEHFPRETASLDPQQDSTSEAAAAHLITTANLLAPDCIRHAFQRDPLVQAGRAAIAEFGEAAFGPNSSVIAQRELASNPPVPPLRHARATRDDLPRDQWDWHNVQGMEFKDSDADIRPGDPPLEFRFALTWNESALHLHAEVVDSPAGYKLPPKRVRQVELNVDTELDGFLSSGQRDFQFIYRVGAEAREAFHRVETTATITPTADGFTVEAVIPWSSMGLVPKTGLEFCLTPAAASAGTKEWEPKMKLNWSYARLNDSTHRLGRVRLE
jgi:hypothetical protein